MSGRGNHGIGLETTKYLAQKGATVYVASRNKEKSSEAIAEMEKGLNGKGGPIKFHQCDLASLKGAKESAEAFKRVESRIDILVANAGISMAFRDELSPDGYEKTFATNHLGHMAFIMSLLCKYSLSCHSTPTHTPIHAFMKISLKPQPKRAVRLASSL